MSDPTVELNCCETNSIVATGAVALPIIDGVDIGHSCDARGRYETLEALV